MKNSVNRVIVNVERSLAHGIGKEEWNKSSEDLNRLTSYVKCSTVLFLHDPTGSGKWIVICSHDP